MLSQHGCELWNYNSRYINSFILYVTWRKVIKANCSRFPYKLFGYPDNYLVYDIVEHITVRLDRCLAKYVHSINSKNSTIHELLAYFLTTESSIFTENCWYLCMNMIFLYLAGMTMTIK